jgi:hypothetical protein
VLIDRTAAIDEERAAAIGPGYGVLLRFLMPDRLREARDLERFKPYLLKSVARAAAMTVAARYITTTS